MRAFLTTLILLGSAATALAQSSCYDLRTEDERRFCLARARNDGAECYSLSTETKRRLCRAQTGHPEECNSIMDEQTRLYCRGITGR